jgi:anti-anti-sigma factor
VYARHRAESPPPVASLHPFRVSLDDLGRVVVVRVQGEVDAATAPHMGETVDRLLGDGRRVVLDLDKVEFMDLHGLAVLMRATRRTSQDRSAFAIARPAACVTRLFELVKLDGQVRILPDGSEPLDAA